MRLAAFCVRRPVLTVMITLIAVTFGLNAMGRLPVDLLPEINYPTVRVSTQYPGAGPEEVESQITRLVENAVAPVSGVEGMTSLSGEGVSDVTLSFAWGTDLQAAANEIRERLDRIVIQNLPPDASRPRLDLVDLSDRPVKVVGVSAPLDPIELRQLVEDRIRDRLERVSGVGVVDVWGGLEREVEVAVDRGRMHSLGLSLEEIRQALQDADFEVAAGTRREGRLEPGLRVPGRLTDLDELAEVVVGRGDGAVIRLGQVAEIRDTHELETRRVRINGEPSIRLAIRGRSDANTVATARALRQELERLQADIPWVHFGVVFDSARYIERSMDNLGRAIFIGGGFALLVLLGFLRDLRAVAVAAVAVPVSLITTFALVYLAGFTINLMTMGGMALGVGLMVDNAIVVLEAVMARRERGDPPREAAVDGTAEVAPAVTASTLTTLAIFLPLIFLEGLAGELFYQLAWVVGFALLCSLAVAFTVVPMLAARLPHGGGPIRRAGLLVALDRGYRRLLAGALNHRAEVLAVAVAGVALAVVLYPRLGTELLPGTDEGDIRAIISWEPGVALEFMDERVQRLERLAAEAVPELEYWVSSSGSGGFRAGGTTVSRLDLSLVPLAERRRDSEEIATELRRLFANVPGAEVRVRVRQHTPLRGGFGAGGEALTILVSGFDLAELDRLGRAMGGIVEEIEGVTDIRYGREAALPEERFLIDRARAADLDVPVSRIASTLETSLAGGRAGLYRDGGDEVTIRVRLDGARHMDREGLLDLTVPNRQGELVALRSVVRVDEGAGPMLIQRQDRRRVITVQANISGRDLGSVAAEARERLMDIPLPRGYDWRISGQYEEQTEALAQLAFTLIMAVALVYMVMASLYESLRDPLVVMFTVPLAGIGVVGLLWLTGTTLNAQSVIGAILLVGIAVNNGILLVDRANRARQNGLGPRAAALAAGRRRLRPILMTSLTTALALLPLALGLGEGAEAQAPMARAVLGGLMTATLISLVVIPVAYTLFHPRHGRGM